VLEPISRASNRTSVAAGAAQDKIEAAAWLTSSCLLLVGDLRRGTGEPSLALQDGRSSTQLESRRISTSKPGSPNGDVPEATAVFVVLPEGTPKLDGGTELEVRAGDAVSRFTSAELSTVTTNLQSIVRRVFAPLDADARSEVLGAFASILNIVPQRERRSLSEKLFEARQALRERLPIEQVKGPKAHADRLMAVDERSFYIEGWLQEGPHKLARLTAVSPEGSRAELLERIFRYPRPDVDEFLSSHGTGAETDPGFVCFFELDAPSVRPDGWVLELENEEGLALELPVPAAVGDPLEIGDKILEGAYVEAAKDELIFEHLFPSFSRIQRRLRRDVEAESVWQLGSPPESPDVSILVPLTEPRHLEVQLSQLADDPELFEAADLVYLLASPEMVDAVEHAADVFPIYRVPFRIAVPAKSVGLVGAIDLGGGLARGRLLLLMEADVVPRRPGWLGRLRDFYDSTPSIGALGPKLLYEDDSIEHAGTYFFKRPGSSSWTHASSFRGMHRSLPAANVARPVAALSKACLMIDRALFDRVGGLPGIYVEEGYEGSDLCLQLAEQRLECWYLPDVELYHAQVPRGPEERRPAAERYDRWLHSHRWGDQLGRTSGDP
jgi:hypothetical protein